jgi:hypothetical protein
MNTPDLSADNTADEGNQTSSMDVLEAQLLRNQFQRVQPRNYRRILRESNAPAPWYSKKSSPPCSIYFYDPQYQKYLQDRSAVQNPSKITVRIRVLLICPHCVLCHSSWAERRFDFRKVHRTLLRAIVCRLGRVTSSIPMYPTVTSHRHAVETPTIIPLRLAGNPCRPYQ